MNVGKASPPERPTTRTDPQGRSHVVGGSELSEKVVAGKKEIRLPGKGETKAGVSSLGQCTILLYGEKKIGKTSLASCFPSAYFLFFEPGYKGLDGLMRDEPASWTEFKQYVALLCQPGASDHIQTVVIDTVDKCYDKCFAAVMARLGTDYPPENDFGRSWKQISGEFQKALDPLLNSGKGVIFTSHATEKEVQERTGAKYDKLVQTMSGQARSYMSGVADVIAYYGYYGSERYITIAGSEALDAGTRLKRFFWTPSGERVHSIPAGKTEEEAYHNFVAAFNNQQEDPHNLDARRANLKEGAKKRR